MNREQQLQSKSQTNMELLELGTEYSMPKLRHKEYTQAGQVPEPERLRQRK